jgi:hypothetical protein
MKFAPIILHTNGAFGETLADAHRYHVNVLGANYHPLRKPLASMFALIEFNSAAEEKRKIVPR